MKKILLKNLDDFRRWQFANSKVVDEKCQIDISKMELPRHFPFLLVWTFSEIINFETRFHEPFDHFEYEYVYIDSFPMKEIKTGTYVYQMVRTDERFMEIMEH